MKVLIYGNRKQDDEIYDISSPAKEAAAYRKIFETLDSYWQVYEDITSIHRRWYDLAKKGSDTALIKLMNARRTYEYEKIREANVINPLGE